MSRLRFFFCPSGFRARQTLDIEYRFDDKIPSALNSKYDKWRRMTFGKGGATFVGDSRVKLPFMKPNVYGVINYFLPEVDFFFFFIDDCSLRIVYVYYHSTIVVDNVHVLFLHVIQVDYLVPGTKVYV